MENNAQFEIIFYRESSSSQVYQEINKQFAEDYCSNIHLVGTPIELANYLKKHENVLLIMRVNNSLEIKEISAILKRFKKKIKTNCIKPMAIMNEMRTSDKIVLQNVGCHALYPKTVKVERLIDDAKKWLFVLETRIEKEEAKQLVTGTIEENPHNTENLLSQNDETKDAELIEAIENSEVAQADLEEGQLNVYYESESFGKVPCRLEHFSDIEIEIEVDASFAAIANKEISIGVEFIYAKCRVELQLEGKILEAEALPNGNQLIVMSSDTDASMLENFMGLYQKRQKSIHEFMALAKGY